MNNLFKRIITSLILLSILLISLFSHKYFWILLISIISVISFIEFNFLIKKIYKKKNKHKIYFINLMALFHLLLFTYSSIEIGNQWQVALYTLSICVMSDIGGYVVGKTVKGKKLTKISPNKTISGSVGSFLFSMIPLFILTMFFQNYDNLLIKKIIIITLILSLISQLGDLFISYFKRKAKVKDTGRILPGHGGLLDRIDGLLFVVPAVILISKFI